MKNSLVRNLRILIIVILFLISACQPTADYAGTVTEVPATTSFTPTPDLPGRFLFVGNSLTYWNQGVYAHFKGLVSSADLSTSLDVKEFILSGENLETLWGHGRKLLQDDPVDMVVLQATPDLEVKNEEDREKFREFFGGVVEEIRGSGAEIVLFVPWETNWQGHLTLAEYSEIYNELAAEHNIKVAPAGLAWEQVWQERPDFELYDSDRVHSNVSGTYLAASVIYATIFDQSPEGIPFQPADLVAGVEGLEHQYSKLLMSEEDTIFLQSVAWKTVHEFSGLALDLSAESQTAEQDETETPDILPTAGASSSDLEFELFPGVPFWTVEDNDLRMDIAVPASGTGPYPTVIFIFGGGWRSGGRAQFTRHVQLTAKRGYVGATIDHRLVKIQNGQPVNNFPAQVHDVKCAVRWLRENAEIYQIDPERIGVVGWSSGGHLALMLAFSDSSDQLEGSCGDINISSSVQAAVNLAGPFDFRSDEKDSAVEMFVKNFLGGDRNEASENYVLASPLFYADIDDPPVLIIAGEKDKSVQPEQLALLDESLTAIGLPHQYVLLEGMNHLDIGYVYEDVFDLIFEFLDETLR